MQFGFVIDHSRCIGCHACTVACKSENDVPVGKFRTWVKYVEKGEFPKVRRDFAVLRCNQCTSAPCVSICPTIALHKRDDGVVDIASDRCIGCKSCMQACPYDAIYIDDDHGTAEKCHFCVHRTEQGLAPACAVVCPTEAIIPGDFHDPESRVSELRRGGELTARKTEAGTGPNVWYREVASAGVEPLAANAAGGYLWSNQAPGSQLDAQRFEADLERQAHRTTLDIPKATPWGAKVSAYLFTKSIAAGALLLPMLSLLVDIEALAPVRAVMTPLLAVAGVALLLTLALLIADLKRPERFWFLLTKGNPGSWLVRGGWILGAFGAVLGLLGILQVFELEVAPAFGKALAVGTIALGALTAMYTAWLFAQCKGRVLWMQRGLAWHLLVQAGAAGSAVALLLMALKEPAVGSTAAEHTEGVRIALAAFLSLHLAFLLTESKRAPRGRTEEYRRAARLVHAGPYARAFWGIAILCGCVLPLPLLFAASAPAVWMAAAAIALVGLWTSEVVLVRAGQALPIS